MSTESIDIIRRRPIPAAYETSQTTSIRKSVVRSGRRKKNSAGGDRAACIAMIAFAAIFIPLGLLMKSCLGRGSTAAGVGTTDSNSNNGGPNPGNFVQNWKPKSLRSGHGNNNVALDTTKTTRKTTVDNPKEARYQSLYQPKFDQSNLGYDIYNCPSAPPDDYPRAWSATEVLTNWNPNDVTTIPPNYREIYHSLCIFDFQTQYDTALAYRNAEKPFIIRNDPNVMNVVKRWDDDLEYLHKECE